MPITATSTEPSTARAGLDRTALTAVVVCWLFVVFDGYDLIVYGNVISSLQKDWGISPATAGTLGS
ncbi:MAG: MFS transporter, partial [Mycobacterium sp.]